MSTLSGEQRREQLLADLIQADKPISASAFAKKFDVSRQIIVGDVALSRAAGLAIRATSRGYVLENDLKTTRYQGQLVCQHLPQETKAELDLIVAHGGEVIDVIVEHPLYGELKGNLDLKSFQDVTNFMTLLEKEEARLLSDLTAGIHLHTIIARDQAHFEEIKEALSEAKFLYQD